MVSDFNKKGNREFFNNELLFKTVGIAFLIFIVFMIFSDIKIYRKKQTLTAEINTYKKQVENIKNSSKNLKDEIANANNPDYLEKIGYEQFAVTKPGETEYMFVRSPKKADTASKTQNSSWSAWLSSSWQWMLKQIHNK